MIFDSHAHYDDIQFDLDRESLLGSLLKEKGVSGVINCSSTVESIGQTLELAQKYDYVYAAVGLHPSCLENLPENYFELVETAAENEKVVAIGECGLDYYYDEVPKDVQEKVFVEHIKLSQKLDLPLILHDRDAHGDMMDILRKYKPKAVMHCFSGSVEMAKELVKMGIYIGMGGVVTFKNAKQSVQAIKEIPLDKLLLETDCPYLSPEPFRGKRNDSSKIEYIAQKIAEIKGIEKSEVLKISRENVKALFKI